MQAMIECWKALARDMNIRIFCMPDSTVRRHMHDCYKILEMLGAPLPTFLAFQDIQLETLRRIREEEQRRLDHENIKWGVPIEFKLPTWVVSGDDAEDDNYEGDEDQNRLISPFLPRK